MKIIVIMHVFTVPVEIIALKGFAFMLKILENARFFQTNGNKRGFKTAIEYKTKLNSVIKNQLSEL